MFYLVQRLLIYSVEWIVTKCIKHLKSLWLMLFTLRGRESHSTSELRSWWQTSGASWRPEEREPSSASTGSPCLLTIGFPRLLSTLEHCDTRMRWCRPWRTVRHVDVSQVGQTHLSGKELTFHVFMSGVLQASCSVLETGERSRSEVVRFGLWSWSKTVFASWCRRETCRHAALTQQSLTSTCGLMPNNTTKRWPTFPYTTHAVFTTDKLPGSIIYKCSSGTNALEWSRISGARYAVCTVGVLLAWKMSCKSRMLKAALCL